MKRFISCFSLILALVAICYNTETNAQKTTNPVIYTSGVPATCAYGRIYVNVATGFAYTYKTAVGCTIVSTPFTGGTITSSIIPNANNTLDLGSSAFGFRSIYFSTSMLSVADGGATIGAVGATRP